MSKNIPDKKLLVIEVNGSYDPVLIATDVKNIIIADFICGVKYGFHIRKIYKWSRFDDLAPCLQGTMGSRMFF
jgi:hypothetical protein